MPVRAPEVGETVNVWGETFVWTTSHPTEKDLDPLLYTYDKIGGDAYDRAIEIFTEQQEALKKEGAPSKGPPAKPDVFKIIRGATTDPICNKLIEEANAVPDWVDWDQIGRGQDIFYRYAMANGIALGLQSLFVGMAAARVVEVLARTGGFALAAAQRRGFETGQWMLEAMDSVEGLKPGGDGWIATLRIRLLHSAVRSRLMKMAKERPEYFDLQAYGTPINDLHQVATIATFCSAPIWYALPKLKISLRKQEIEDYIALWRYLAYLLGTPDHFFETPDKALKIQESVMYIELHPNENSKVLANNLLDAFKKDSPIKLPSGLINASARHLAGNELCDEWDIGRPNIIWKGVWRSNVSLQKGLIYMCRSIPWMDKKQIKMMKTLSWKLVVESKYGMKGEKSKFAMKYNPHFNLTKAE